MKLLFLTFLALGLPASGRAQWSAATVEEFGNQVCEVKSQQVPVDCPDVPPPKLPKTCSGFSGSWWGDPHFTTFDKLKYDCMGEGAFDIVRSKTKNDFALQGRFKKANPRFYPTVTRGIAFQTGDGEPAVEVTVPDHIKGACNPTVKIGGTEQVPETLIRGQNNAAIHVQKIRCKQGTGYVFYYEHSEVQLQVWARGSAKNGCVLAAEICLPDCLLEKHEFVGMLGTPNNDKGDEWHGRDGQAVKFQGGRKNAKAQYDYCTRNWCINDRKESLFTYTSHQPFEKFDKCQTEPYDEKKASGCIVAQSKIEAICGADNHECIVDGCTQGEDAAKHAVQQALDFVDRNCGKEIFSENFDQVEVGSTSFGGIVKHKDASKEVGAKMATNYLNLNHDASKAVWEWNTDTYGKPTMVQINFNLYEIGSWEDTVARSGARDSFLMTINDDVTIDIGRLHGKRRDND